MRPIAYKVSIKELHDLEFIKSDTGSCLAGIAGKIERARVFATVISKEKQEAHSLLVLDDGSDTVSAKFFEPCKLSVGDTADFFVFPKENNEGERYLLVEFARKISDPNFECLRRLELAQIEKNRKHALSEKSKATIRDAIPKENTIPDKKYEPVTDLKRLILKLIESSDSGMPYESILTSKIDFNEQEIENAVRDLLNRGEIYEPKIGIYKRLS